MAQSDVKCDCMPAEALGALLLRLALGSALFFFGLSKFLGEGGVLGAARGITDMFKTTYLPSMLVSPLAHLIPFAEVVLGLLLVLGLMTRAALLGSGLLLVLLTAGVAVLGKPDVAANNLIYVGLIAAAMWLASKDNRYSLDRLFKIH